MRPISQRQVNRLRSSPGSLGLFWGLSKGPAFLRRFSPVFFKLCVSWVWLQGRIYRAPSSNKRKINQDTISERYIFWLIHSIIAFITFKCFTITYWNWICAAVVFYNWLFESNSNCLGVARHVRKWVARRSMRRRKIHIHFPLSSPLASRLVRT